MLNYVVQSLTWQKAVFDKAHVKTPKQTTSTSLPQQTYSNTRTQAQSIPYMAPWACSWSKDSEEAAAAHKHTPWLSSLTCFPLATETSTTHTTNVKQLSPIYNITKTFINHMQIWHIFHSASMQTTQCYQSRAYLGQCSRVVLSTAHVYHPLRSQGLQQGRAVSIWNPPLED
jgi:hypothetical protein